MNRRSRWLLLPLAALLLLLLTACDFNLYIAHYTYQTGWTTRISIKNPYSQDVTVTVKAYNDSGTEMASKALTIPAFGHYKNYVQNVFSPTVIPSTGSLKLICSEPGYVPKVSAIVLFEYTASDGNKALGGLQSLGNPQRVLNFPWFENSSTSFTGIAIQNVSDYTVLVSLKATTASGTAYYSNGNYRLEPMQRIIGYPSTFFGSLPSDCTMTAVASGPIAGFMILHDATVHQVEAINAVPVQPKYPDLEAGSRSNPNIDLGGSARMMVFSPDGNFLYVRLSTGDIKAIDVNNYSGGVFNTVNLTSYGDIAMSASGRTLYAANKATDQVLYMTPPISGTAVSVHTLTTVTDVEFLATSNNGLYLGATGGKSWKVLNATTGATIFSGATTNNCYQCCFSSDSKYFFTTETSANLVHWYNTTNGSTGTITTPDQPYFLTYSDYNSTLNVGPNFSSVGLIWRYNVPAMTATSSLSVPGHCYRTQYAPDGKKIYFTPTTGDDLYVYDAVYGNMHTYTGYLGGSPVYATGMDPAGEKVYWVVGNFLYYAY